MHDKSRVELCQSSLSCSFQVTFRAFDLGRVIDESHTHGKQRLLWTNAQSQ